MSRLIFFDCETTGRDPVKNDIIEMAGIIYKDLIAIDKFHFFVRPVMEQNIEEEALKVNGLKRGQILLFPSAKSVAKSLEEVLLKHWVGIEDQYCLVAHNADFDTQFLKNFLYKAERFDMARFIDFNSSVDTLALAKFLRALKIIDSKYLSLGRLAKYFGHAMEKEDKHTATGDVEALVHVYNGLQGKLINPRKCSMPDYKQMSLFGDE